MIASGSANHPPEELHLPTAVESFKLLIWLKWTLILRAYARQKLRIWGAALMVLTVLPLSIFLSVSCYLFSRDSPQIADVVIKGIFLFVYALWLITPLLGFPLNESYDPTRLFTYPVPLRIIFAAGVIGSIFEITTLLAVPLFVVIILLSTTGILSGVVAFLAVLLFLVHTLATAQLIMLSVIGFLRSRRFRDMTMVLFPVLGMTFYFGQQVIFRQMLPGNFFGAVLHWPIWSYVGWIPSGWAGTAVIAARDGRFGMALLCLCGLAVVSVVPILLAAQVMKSMYLGDRGTAVPATATAAGSVRMPRTAPASAESSQNDERPHQEILALIHKELIYLVREPQYKALGVNTLYTVVVMFFAFTFNHASSSFGGSNIWQQGGNAGPLMSGIHVVFSNIFPTVLLLATLPLTFNIFGGDASAITVLLSFPTPRRKLFIAKNLAHAPVVVGLCTIGVILGAFLLHQSDLLLLEFCWILLATPVVMGAGNLVSVRFPHKLMVRGQRWGRGGQVSFGSGPSGCGYAFVYLACYLAALALLVPVAAAVIGPVAFGAPGVLAITVPLGLIYSALVYGVATTLASGMLDRRWSEMIAILAPDE